MHTVKSSNMNDKLVDGLIGIIPLLILFIIVPYEILLFILYFAFYGIYLFIKYKSKKKNK
jgi:hypothetical protein